MTRLLGAGLTAAAAAFVFALVATRWGPRALNHRGKELSLGLGTSLSLAGMLAAFFWAAPEARFGPWLLVAAAGVVWAAGSVDDRWGGSERGFRGHLGGLARGRLTTGIAKVVLVVAAAAGFVLLLDGPGLRTAAGTVTIAACSNLWNVLDVRPGRALKAFIPLQAAIVWMLFPSAFSIALTGVLGASLAALWFDLREKAMLGDAGSNVLGFVIGVGLYVLLPLGGLVLALVVVLGLQLAAETVTLSRLIDAIAPFRWYDRIGTVREEKRAPG